MEFRIGNGLIIGGSSKYCLSSPIQGLDSASIRVGSGVYAGRDGGFVSGHFYGNRTIVLNGFYIGNDCDDAVSLRNRLMAHLAIRYILPVVIVDFSDNYYYTEAYFTNIKADITGPKSGVFQITLLCPDPTLYIPSDKDSPTSVNREISFSLTSQNNYTQTDTVNNTGSASTYIQVAWNGNISNLIAANNTTGKYLGVSDLTSGDTMIDFQKRLIVVDGVGKNSYRTTGSEWWALQPGSNEIEIKNATSSGSYSGRYYYKIGVTGI